MYCTVFHNQCTCKSPQVRWRSGLGSPDRRKYTASLCLSRILLIGRILDGSPRNSPEIHETTLSSDFVASGREEMKNGGLCNRNRIRCPRKLHVATRGASSSCCRYQWRHLRSWLLRGRQLQREKYMHHDDQYARGPLLMLRYKAVDIHRRSCYAAH